jgi:hypothetical protein
VHGLQQPCLADPGLARQQQQVALAFAHGRDPPLGEGEQLVPPVNRVRADVRRH